jgi:hypothetical protein
MVLPSRTRSFPARYPASVCADKLNLHLETFVISDEFLPVIKESVNEDLTADYHAASDCWLKPVTIADRLATSCAIMRNWLRRMMVLI